MKIACIGGGPAGLYFALLMKKADPSHEVTVYERNRPFDTFGWGVVFSEETLRNLKGGDAESQQRIIDSFAHWDDIEVLFKGRSVRSGGHGFCGIERRHLLSILQERCAELGVTLAFETEVAPDLSQFAGHDLVVAGDGINSRVRAAFAEHFRPQVELRRNKYVWLGTKKLFDAFTFIFEETPGGWFQAHAYRFNDDTSTFIIETTAEAWAAAGLEHATTADTIAFGERLFGKYLDGHRLMSNSRHLTGSDWLNFPRVSCERWVRGNLVLVGDAAHSAHYSIGSGTKLALEDAIALAAKVTAQPHDLPAALAAYEAERRVEVLKIQSAARNSTEWFENVARYAHFEPEQFAYSLLTRSQRISHENLRLRDPGWLEGYERWLAGRLATDTVPERPNAKPVPPMFTPFALRGMTLANRVVVSPMATYSAVEGTPTDFHLVHYGSRAQGGAGLVFTEMTCVSAEARITPGCAGLYSDDHTAAWKRVVDFIHSNSAAKICLQLGHAGPKGSTKRGWEGMDEPLEEGNWPLLAPSPLPWSPRNQVPREMTIADMESVVADFIAATERAERAGFDMLELHAAHGYLLSAFISPLTNKRTDEFGGSLPNRLRFPLAVFRAMRGVWPAHKPMSVRISATDWHADGLTPEESVQVAKAFHDAGADLLDVSAGQTSRECKPVYGRMFQTPLSDRIRNEARVPTMAVGNITEPDHVNGIIAGGRADLVALARPHLSDPYFTLHAAARLGYDAQPWPDPYLPGRTQYLRALEKEAEMAVRI